MRLSALRLPLFAHDLFRKPQVHFSGSCVRGGSFVKPFAKLGRDRAARTDFCVVIAGLDPAIHADAWLAGY
jgi:hypothetical protein